MAKQPDVRDTKPKPAFDPKVFLKTEGAGRSSRNIGKTSRYFRRALPREEPKFSEMFVAHVLERTIRVDAISSDVGDHTGRMASRARLPSLHPL